MAKIKEIESNSISSQLGLVEGDEIIAINGKKINDYIDYQYETSERYFTLTVKKINGKIKKYDVERDYGDILGIKLDGIIYDGLKKCNNDCIFCFVKQQPDHLRDSLLIKDDDYRFSFLEGSFITLSNLNDSDWKKIINKRLSPLYISVHTTNPELRIKMMKNPKTANILDDLNRLKDNNIKFHAQLVLCPGLNDGQELKKSLDDLEKFYPSLLSLGVVPVGLTKYRDNLEDLSSYDKQNALEVLHIIETKQKELKNKYSTNFLYASDEFYLLANKKIPPYEEYNGFPQIENGIGLTRLLWKELDEIENSLPQVIANKKITIVTSVLAAKVLKVVVNKLNEIKGLDINILVVKNDFFGNNVTVAGLLTGQDIYNTIKNNTTASNIIIPGIALNDNNYFLDGMSYSELQEKLVNKNLFVCNNIKEIVEVL